MFHYFFAKCKDHEVLYDIQTKIKFPSIDFLIKKYLGHNLNNRTADVNCRIRDNITNQSIRQKAKQIVEVASPN